MNKSCFNRIKVINFVVVQENVHVVTVIVVENENDVSSSNPRRGCFYFTER